MYTIIYHHTAMPRRSRRHVTVNRTGGRASLRPISKAICKTQSKGPTTIIIDNNIERKTPTICGTIHTVASISGLQRQRQMCEKGQRQMNVARAVRWGGWSYSLRSRSWELYEQKLCVNQKTQKQGAGLYGDRARVCPSNRLLLLLLLLFVSPNADSRIWRGTTRDSCLETQHGTIASSDPRQSAEEISSEQKVHVVYFGFDT